MPGMKQIQEEVWAELKSRTTVTWLRIPHADLTWLNVASSWFHIPKISTEYEWLPQNTTKIKPLCTINFIFSSFYRLTCLLQTTYWLNFMVNKAHKGQQYDTVQEATGVIWTSLAVSCCFLVSHTSLEQVVYTQLLLHLILIYMYHMVRIKLVKLNINNLKRSSLKRNL